MQAAPWKNPLVCSCAKAGGFTNLRTDGGEWWVHAPCGKPTEAWFRGQGDAVLNYFRGGPIDGAAYETSTLTSPSGLGLPLIEYHWTPEIITSSATGRSARVWIHTTLVNGEDSSVQAAVGGSTADAVPSEGDSPMAETTDLETRRKALKLSRKQVAEASGLTEAQVYRVEKGGARTKEEETTLLATTLDKFADAASAAVPQ